MTSQPGKAHFLPYLCLDSILLKLIVTFPRQLYCDIYIIKYSHSSTYTYTPSLTLYIHTHTHTRTLTHTHTMDLACTVILFLSWPNQKTSPSTHNSHWLSESHAGNEETGSRKEVKPNIPPTSPVLPDRDIISHNTL